MPSGDADYSGCRTCKNGMQPVISAEKINGKWDLSCTAPTSIAICEWTFGNPQTPSPNAALAPLCSLCKPNYASANGGTSCDLMLPANYITGCKYYKMGADGTTFLCDGCGLNYVKPSIGYMYTEKCRRISWMYVSFWWKMWFMQFLWRLWRFWLLWDHMNSLPT